MKASSECSIIVGLFDFHAPGYLQKFTSFIRNYSYCNLYDEIYCVDRLELEHYSLISPPVKVYFEHFKTLTIGIYYLFK